MPASNPHASPNRVAYSAEFRANALALVAEIGLKPAARRLGVPRTTLYRWAHPEYAARLRARSRELKRGKKQPCVRGCGRLTSYDRPGGVCIDCTNSDREPPHGTLSRYTSEKWRCRCVECRAANAEAARRFYARHRKDAA